MNGYKTKKTKRNKTKITSLSKYTLCIYTHRRQSKFQNHLAKEKHWHVNNLNLILILRCMNHNVHCSNNELYSIKTTYMLLVHLALHAIVYEMSLRVLKFAVSHSRGQGSTQGTKQEEVGSISYNGPWHIITFFVPLSPTEGEAKRFVVLVPSLGSSPVHRPRNTICHSGVKWHLSSVISIAASGRPWLRQPYGLWLCVTTVTQMRSSPLRRLNDDK